MRKFLVLGYLSNAVGELGQTIYFGGDRLAAQDEVDNPAGGFLRKEIFELGVPSKRKLFDDEVA